MTIFAIIEHTDELYKNYNMNGIFFVLLLSLKWVMIGFFIPIFSRSVSFNFENFTPSMFFLISLWTIRSLMRMYRKNVDISSTEKAWMSPSFGIVNGLRSCIASDDNDCILCENSFLCWIFCCNELKLQTNRGYLSVV